MSNESYKFKYKTCASIIEKETWLLNCDYKLIIVYSTNQFKQPINALGNRALLHYNIYRLLTQLFEFDCAIITSMFRADQ